MQNTQNNSTELGLETINSPKFDLSIFEVKEGKVNLTKVCQFFGKDINEWKRLPSVISFLSALETDMGKSQIGVIKGGNGEQGTFASRQVALKLAQWISPEFEVFCIQKLDELFQTGSTSLQKQLILPTNYLEALEALLASEKEKEQLRLESEANKDKVEFANQLLDTTNSIDFKSAAKALHLPYGRNLLFAKCRELKILDRKNQPYQEYIDSGYFVVMEYSFVHPVTGDRMLTLKTMVTAKGQKFLTKKLNENESRK